jgi:hypothetical protein
VIHLRLHDLGDLIQTHCSSPSSEAVVTDTASSAAGRQWDRRRHYKPDVSVCKKRVAGDTIAKSTESSTVTKIVERLIILKINFVERSNKKKF